MELEITELPTSKVGKAYEFNDSGKNHNILETQVNAYRGNHIHPHDQHTLLIRGRARYVLVQDERREFWLKEGEIFVTPAGVPHIMVPEEDTLTFEWWDGPFEYEEIQGLFKDLIEGRAG